MKKELVNLIESALVENDMEINPNESLAKKEESVREAFENLMAEKGLDKEDYDITIVDSLFVFFTVTAPENLIMKAQYTFNTEDNKIEFEDLPFSKKEMTEEEVEEIIEDETTELPIEIIEHLEEGKIYKATQSLRKLAERKIDDHINGKKAKSFKPEVEKKAKKLAEKVNRK